ncbi:NOG [Cordylochernes scorpioides]|uniref:NOG n=1 Tax=Cordylochernes scorpioides TaxID=51811 RepID=A0ABY6LFQ4_9ARAC|nr:NOG [Cordylochernes scorpioides]
MTPTWVALAAVLLATSAARRVRPSSDLPVLDLIEPQDSMYDPPPSDIDPRALRARLGPHYDPRYMSETRPINRSSPVPSIPTGRMPRELRRLKLRSIRLADGTRLRSRRARRRAKLLLWAFSYCPVAPRWKDLGIRFWPRWLNDGTCLPKPCSFPPGMSCRPSRSTRKTILRWYCPNWTQKKNCRWIPIKYPVITGCECSCASSSS